MVFLQHADNASRLAVIRPGGLWLLGPVRSRLLKKSSARQVSGQFGEIGGTAAALYLAGGRLWLAIAGQAWLLDNVKAEIEESEHDWVVRIDTPTGAYEARARRSSEPHDVTALADDEDFFFGLWVARIIRDERRRRVLAETLCDASLEDVPRESSDPPQEVIDPRASWDHSPTDGEEGRRAHD